MKYVTNDFYKIALAALILGVFSLSPLAKAQSADQYPGWVHDSENWAASPIFERAPATVIPTAPPPAAEAEAQDDSSRADGMTMDQIRKVAPHFRPLRLKGDTIVFEGKMPRKCSVGVSLEGVDSTPSEDGKSAQHGVKINMPSCQGKVLTPAELKDEVDVAKYLNKLKIESSLNGKVCLLNAETQSDEPTCEDAKGADKKPLMYVSQASKDNEAEVAAAEKKKIADAQAAKDAKATRKRHDDEFIAHALLLCKNGDFIGLGDAIAGASNVLGDVAKILEKIEKAKQNTFEKAVIDAKSLEDMSAAFQDYTAAAEENDWKTGEMTRTYLNRVLEQKDEKPSDIAAAIRESGSDEKPLLAWAYSKLATNLMDADKLDEAEKYYTKAAELSDAEGKIKVEAQMSAMFNHAKEACLLENKLKPAKCDSLNARAKKHATSAVAMQGKKKGESSLEDLNAMKIEYLQEFGQGNYSMNVSGYGSLNLAGGAYDKAKFQLYQQGQAEVYQQQMMQRQMGAMGAQLNTGGSGGGFFH